MNVLACFAKLKLPRGYQGQLGMFFQIFSIDQLTPNGSNSVLFGNLARSDGFSIDFIFYKKRQTGHDLSLQTFDLTLSDFNIYEMKDTFAPIPIDPGQKSVFTVTIGLKSDKQIRRCTIKEYYRMTGSARYTKQLNDKKALSGIILIESNIPSPKASRFTTYQNHVEYMFENLDALLRFYSIGGARDRFSIYQGVQRAPQQMANMLTHGTAKYNRSKRDKKKKKAKKRIKEG
ncbi:uncharacterized protein BX663DRAFT_576051 [Cokeromyces recurvatus]|uniref:uncharacterized protein n=1 Tax=Cokeromyces recurvatus TaxID=90255 RepID=UPI002220C41A|nr:uncharacterized protein BX663DRAFT_576051 [Cokeromyces recurvatus]KAI7899965.1 hypothetical protein BX663DRAFT_576051 [Cokeromyces recurvatus]